MHHQPNIHPFKYRVPKPAEVRHPLNMVATTADPTGVFFGSPSIIVAADGSWVAAHDYHGPRAPNSGGRWTNGACYRSTDQGATWTKTAEVSGVMYGSPFRVGTDLYIVGMSLGGQPGATVGCVKSSDNGATWSSTAVVVSTPSNNYATHPTIPMQIGDYLYFGWGFPSPTQSVWPDTAAAVLVLDTTQDPMTEAAWTVSAAFDFRAAISAPSGSDSSLFGGIEFHTVIVDDELKLFGRGNTAPKANQALLMDIDLTDPTDPVLSNPQLVPMPQGNNRFNILKHPTDGYFYALVNKCTMHAQWPDVPNNTYPWTAQQRTSIRLARSADLLTWEELGTVISEPWTFHSMMTQAQFIGLQYAYAVWDPDDENTMLCVVRYSGHKFRSDSYTNFPAHDALHLGWTRVKIP